VLPLELAAAVLRLVEPDFHLRPYRLHASLLVSRRWDAVASQAELWSDVYIEKTHSADAVEQLRRRAQGVLRTLHRESNLPLFVLSKGTLQEASSRGVCTRQTSLMIRFRPRRRASWPRQLARTRFVVLASTTSRQHPRPTSCHVSAGSWSDPSTSNSLRGTLLSGCQVRPEQLQPSMLVSKRWNSVAIQFELWRDVSLYTTVSDAAIKPAAGTRARVSPQSPPWRQHFFVLDVERRGPASDIPWHTS
jgi:hypothetical protein